MIHSTAPLQSTRAQAQPTENSASSHNDGPDDTEKQFDDRQKEDDEDDDEYGIEERKLDLRRKRNREHSRLSRQRKRRRIEVLLGENEAYHRNNHALHEENLHLRTVKLSPGYVVVYLASKLSV